MKKPELTDEGLSTLYKNKYLSLYSMRFSNEAFYLQASRRSAEDLILLKNEDEYSRMLPDAVTCIVIAETQDSEPRLLLQKEFRYPSGHFLLSPPAGLVDRQDAQSYQAGFSAPQPSSLRNIPGAAEMPPAGSSPDCLQADSDKIPQALSRDQILINTAKRELFEETGIRLKDTDSVKLISPLLFSSPGMTDESNAMVLIKVKLDDLSCLSNSGAEGTELFGGFVLLTEKEALEMINRGFCDGYFSVFTYSALLYFVLMNR